MKIRLGAMALVLWAGFLGAESSAVDVANAAPVAPAALSPVAMVNPWTNSLVASLNVNQTAYSPEWTSGGVDSLAWTANVNGSAERKLGLVDWANNLKLAYGDNKSGNETVQVVSDVIHGDSTYTETLNPYINPYVGMTFDSQFSTGYHYFSGTITPQAVSNFMDPGYVTESLGVGTSQNWFKARLGAASQQVWTRQFEKYASDPDHPNGQLTRVEYGASAMASVKFELAQNLLFSSEVDAFSDLMATDQIQAKWNSLITAKVNSWMSANATSELLYDDSQINAGQFTESVSLAFSYNLL